MITPPHLKYAYDVEERSHGGLQGSLHWHFRCPSCRVMQQVFSGHSTGNCSRCQSAFIVKENGQVFTVVQLADQRELAHTSGTIHPESKRKTGLLGAISSLADAASEANESAHGKRLKDGMYSTGQAMKSLNEEVLAVLMFSFLEKTERIEREIPNWSVAGRIKMGRELQFQAKPRFDFDQAESYALWLAGAWLESGARKSHDAMQVHQTLERLRAQH